MSCLFKAPFRKFVKKQTRPFQLAIEDEVEKIIDKPEIGDLKKGDLAGFRVHKFIYGKQKFLTAYVVHETEIIFIMIGSHENFYHKLKKYLREVK